MKLRMIKNILSFLFSWLTIIGLAQFNIPEKPANPTHLVYDYADVLSPQEEATLDQKLINYEDSTSTQIVVATITSLNDDDINLVGADWIHKWGIGQKDKDNGMIILLSIQDRKISIQNGYGLEEYLTDGNSKKIIDQVFIPSLKQGQYYQSLDRGTDAVFSLLDGKFQGETNNSSDDGFSTILFILIVLLIFFFIFRGGNNGNYNNRRRGYGRDVIFTDSGPTIWGSGGFGGSSGGGGGFGGFGGGDSGGGGASGSW